MFSGIVEDLGKIMKIEKEGSSKSFYIESSLLPDLKVDQSIAHNGVCLTVEEIIGPQYKVTAVAETLKKSNLGHLKKGDFVNLERSLKINGRIDGHLVQGHVDITGKCESVKDENGSWLFSFSFPRQFQNLIVEKGSICINGVSLTCFDVKQRHFTVTIIPYTFNHTNFSSLHEGAMVNLEFDIIGKYVQKNWESYQLGKMSN